MKYADLRLYTLIALFQMISFVIGHVIQPYMYPWYSNLVISVLTPPPIVFPVVWSFLYVVLAIVMDLLLRLDKKEKHRHIIFLFMMQMVMNWMWSPIFFICHNIKLSFVILLSMILLTIFTSWYTYLLDKRISFLLFVYLAWMIFAMYLEAFIVYYN